MAYTVPTFDLVQRSIRCLEAVIGDQPFTAVGKLHSPGIVVFRTFANILGYLLTSKAFIFCFDESC